MMGFSSIGEKKSPLTKNSNLRFIIWASFNHLLLFLFSYYFLLLIFFFWQTEKISAVSVTPSTNLPVEGTSVNLTCEASGPVFTRNWMKDGSELTPTDNMTLSDNNRVLTFNTVNRKDSGEYFCQISNPISSDGAKYIMIVNYGPEKVQIKGPNKINVKGTLKLICSAESTPTARFTWFLNGTEIPSTSAEYIKEEVELSDSGNYTCQAWNNITERTSSSAVHGLTVTVSNVSVTSSSTDLVEFSGSVSLSCSASGSSLSFLWLNGSSEVTASDRVQLTDGGSSLTIITVTRFDQGPFRCSVSNPVSTGTSDPVNLSISYKLNALYLESFHRVNVNFLCSLYI
uniref:Carcinoembryonic antigen-related cell adhesion molecule 5-like n=1 Tax=Oreochromis aureus TaxID=47969 RepID=A0A668STZ0_OREAU